MRAATTTPASLLAGEEDFSAGVASGLRYSQRISFTCRVNRQGARVPLSAV